MEHLHHTSNYELLHAQYRFKATLQMLHRGLRGCPLWITARWAYCKCWKHPVDEDTSRIRKRRHSITREKHDEWHFTSHHRLSTTISAQRTNLIKRKNCAVKWVRSQQLMALILFISIRLNFLDICIGKTVPTNIESEGWLFATRILDIKKNFFFLQRKGPLFRKMIGKYKFKEHILGKTFGRTTEERISIMWFKSERCRDNKT